MRKNLPVTNVETVLPEGEFIYSRTDLKGIIVEANEAFANISNYRREEMLGQPHNIVRHPDMPEEAFADLWADLKAGRPWRGLVKNRRQDGGYYWVVANASPVRENGRIIGYQSVRSKPSREEVAAAEAAYKRISRGDRSLRIEHGRAMKSRSAWLEALSSFRAQATTMGLLAVLPPMVFLLGDLMEMEVLERIGEGMALFTGLYALYFIFHFVPTVQRDLKTVADNLERVLTTGDLKRRFDISRADIIGAIGRRADKFISSVQATVQGMADTAGQVGRASHEVSQGIANVSQSAATQSEATASAAAAVEEMTVSIGEVAANAKNTQVVAVQAGNTSGEGVELSRRATETILALAGTVKASAAQVETLGERSAEISRIAGVIKEIADQTNLLALNAAIEAARAGEQGRGFAVVADEVRKLAERTGQATQEINTLIITIQDETQRAVSGMRSGASQVENGVQLVQEAETALSEINTEMNQTVQMVNEITHASAEQQQAMILLAQNVEQVAGMTEQNVAVVQQTEVMVNYLDQVVDRMRKSVDQYIV
ncbi:methyl-accepting chemotaxis protein [Denitratisoma oestradiolicum]|uniref:Aerotaxis receptor n=1 Tax=Denitratisoma oestradiolicum TaxID=311182 RepID=A0A6S6XY33_9PROT|nr:PAS domain-containing methyl-accepting chemotaxis protein [Denitratisoma oestradiolicum]TWO80780.1 chemotaxis protein [Denitratisoma oestradiolicum]CAB1370904.1 Aerotaxis receptor [Denitratisoma oestradiolicum]